MRELKEVVSIKKSTKIGLSEWNIFCRFQQLVGEIESWTDAYLD